MAVGQAVRWALGISHQVNDGSKETCSNPDQQERCMPSKLAAPNRSR
jgi:hypothetical protein